MVQFKILREQNKRQQNLKLELQEIKFLLLQETITEDPIVDFSELQRGTSEDQFAWIPMTAFSKYKNIHTDIDETEQNASLTEQDNPYREAEIISEV